ncbi:DsbA family protein [Denitromonas iodatirespirans]|uniref:DsbA family protein n=1 Tax=Denitromonas iodatirespirans TaxID=2795389 RepID=A0A944HG01_DENI1|nr:DsbA family protein [Denitromonas iodatirespirans]MBT0964166.1 DsbA family protein [Denitromonas iodatirespirans]
MGTAPSHLPHIEFWFDPASTYSYVAAADVARLEAEGLASFDDRPFLLGPIFARQGWTDSPFKLYRAKGEYMWRDLARLCTERRLPLRWPGTTPSGAPHGRLALYNRPLSSGKNPSGTLGA